MKHQFKDTTYSFNGPKKLNIAKKYIFPKTGFSYHLVRIGGYNSNQHFFEKYKSMVSK